MPFLELLLNRDNVYYCMNDKVAQPNSSNCDVLSGSSLYRVALNGAYILIKSKACNIICILKQNTKYDILNSYQ